MNLQTLCLSVGLGMAVYWDVRYQKIPNILTLTLALIGIALATIEHGLDGTLRAFGGLLVGLGLFFLPFAMGGLGGGDVKLLAAVGALGGPMIALYTGLYGAIAGGLIAILMLLVKRRLAGIVLGLVTTPWQTVKRLASSVSGSTTAVTQDSFPYAIAIAVGAVAALMLVA